MHIILSQREPFFYVWEKLMSQIYNVLYVCWMSRLKKVDKVKLSPFMLEDESRKESHFFFKRIIDEDRKIEVVGQVGT